MHFVSDVFKKAMTQVQLPYSAVYPTSTTRLDGSTKSKSSRHGPYNGQKMELMQCPYTNCKAKPMGRTRCINGSAVHSTKQANHMSTQAGVMSLTASVVLQGQLEDSGVLSGPNMHALLTPQRPLEGPAAKFMADQFNVRVLYVYTVAWHLSLCNTTPECIDTMLSLCCNRVC
jgi:hypothetical protein